MENKDLFKLTNSHLLFFLDEALKRKFIEEVGVRSRKITSERVALGKAYPEIDKKYGKMNPLSAAEYFAVDGQKARDEVLNKYLSEQRGLVIAENDNPELLIDATNPIQANLDQIAEAEFLVLEKKNLDIAKELSKRLNLSTEDALRYTFACKRNLLARPVEELEFRILGFKSNGVNEELLSQAPSHLGRRKINVEGEDDSKIFLEKFLDKEYDMILLPAANPESTDLLRIAKTLKPEVRAGVVTNKRTPNNLLLTYGNLADIIKTSDDKEFWNGVESELLAKAERDEMFIRSLMDHNEYHKLQLALDDIDVFKTTYKTEEDYNKLYWTVFIWDVLQNIKKANVLDDDCAVGVSIREIAFNKDYETKKPRFDSIKRIWDGKVAEDSFFLMNYFFKKRGKINVAHPLIHLEPPRHLKRMPHHIISEFIVGPEYLEIFKELREIRESRPLTDNEEKLRKYLLRDMVRDLGRWQNQSKRLDKIQGKNKDIGEIVEYYQRNLLSAFENAVKYTDTCLTAQHLEVLERYVLPIYALTGIIKPKTTTRILDSSPKNKILRTGRIKDGVSEVLEKLTGKKGVLVPRDVYSKGIRIDLSHKCKYGHILEDFFHIMDCLDVDTVDEERYGFLRELLAATQQKGINAEELDDHLLIPIYRNIRKRDLFLNVYGRKNFQKLIYGRRNEVGHLTKSMEHLENIVHHDKQTELYLIRLESQKRNGLIQTKDVYDNILDDLRHLESEIEEEGFHKECVEMYDFLFSKLEKPMLDGDKKAKHIYEFMAVKYLKNLVDILAIPPSKVDYYEIDK